MTQKITILTRKPNQVLHCGYGHHWPLNLHSSGFVKVVDPDAMLYVWASDRQTLDRLNVKG